MLICPRCNTENCTILAESPIAGCWTVYLCPHCFFSWRSTEPATITDPAQYNAHFKLTQQRMDSFGVVPPVKF